ncbi:hypothetical protein RHGRI_000425 [Rhododendron griersonianum]|uniref:Uncharacterized protein n=1 Tax=Rhododendron griersonianum TaxID=479676 RepID=A0AAV6LJE1_9ERIC|nr:hypothetical protein RHGRI_000425 [Rhododendron griersonianum]
MPRPCWDTLPSFIEGLAQTTVVIFYESCKCDGHNEGPVPDGVEAVIPAEPPWHAYRKHHAKQDEAEELQPKSLDCHDIVPGTKLYTPEEIKISIENAWRAKPLLKCNIDGQRDLQLLEIVICITRPTQEDNTFHILPCPGRFTTSCIDQYKKKIMFPPVTTLRDARKYLILRHLFTNRCISCIYA